MQLLTYSQENVFYRSAKFWLEKLKLVSHLLQLAQVPIALIILQLDWTASDLILRDTFIKCITFRLQHWVQTILFSWIIYNDLLIFLLKLSLQLCQIFHKPLHDLLGFRAHQSPLLMVGFHKVWPVNAKILLVQVDSEVLVEFLPDLSVLVLELPGEKFADQDQ